MAIDLSASRAAMILACAASRAHSDLAGAAYKEYGDTGPLISGCVASHFPDAIKDRLRQLARECREYSDAAYMARPYRARRATITRLGKDIATRDGAGFYGPRPHVIREG